MGNCITFERVVSWVDDDEWDLPELGSPGYSPDVYKPKEQQQAAIRNGTEEEDLKQPDEVLPAVMKPTQVVRIKISKKQLAELLMNAESHGLTVQEPGKRCRVKRRMGQYWMPVLQSIPEIGEEGIRCPSGQNLVR